MGYGHGRHCCCHGYGHGHGWGPGWRDYWPSSRDEMVEDMEDYKARLEAEIAALEKRINSLKQKEPKE